MGSPTRELVVVVPWHVDIPRKTMKPKKVALNMNTYRNLHHRTNNQAKIILKELMRDQLEGVSLETPVEVTVQVEKPSRRRLDKGNVYAVASKYLYDAMSEYEVWPDDNDDHVKKETILPTILADDKVGKIIFTFRSCDVDSTSRG